MTADGKTEIDLAWTAPDDTGGAAVSGYRIEVSSDAGSNWADLVANTGTTATTYAHTGLAAGTERHYRVSATNSAGTGTASNVVSATTAAAGAPGAPTDLTATADGRTAIDLAWTAPADNGGSAISGYRIEVSSDGGSNWTDLVSDTASTATSYEHTNLDPGTTRHYRVSAINTAGTGSASNVAHATTEAEPPGAPTGLSATADGKTAIDLAWTVPDDTGGAAVSGYRIEVSSDAGSNWADLVANTGTTATTYAHTGLAAGTERHYRVSAINTAGTGTASNVASATTSAAGAPGAPTDLTATADGRTAIDLAWTAPADNGGSAISGYRIEVSSDGGSNWTDLVSDTASTATSYEHTNLDPGTERHYRVSAINTAGTGSASNVAHAATEAEPPGAPTGLTATADGKTAIDLAWTTPDDTGGAAVSGYRIEVSSDAGSNWADLVANTGSTATTYAHTGLAAGTERHYRVSAINTAGAGTASNVASATTSAAGAPGAPTGLTATADGKMAIDLAWTAPADNGGSAISGYRIEVSSDGGSNWADLVSDTASTATSYEHTNLDPGTTRHYRVSAINTAGTGPASNVAHATTEAEPPGAPTGLTATADGKTAIDLAWTAPDDTGGAAVSGYRIEVSSDAGSNWADLVANTGSTATTYAHTGLAAGTERHYRVSAINTAGAGTASNVASATTSAAGAPGAPTGLTAPADGKMAIDLAWTAPDDNGGSAISGYRIEVSSDGGSNWSDLVSDTASTATTYAHTNLDPGTTRHYRVSAINTAGTGPASNVAHATTEAAPPGAPTGLTATADGKTEIDLAWTAPDDTGGAAVSGYRIEVSADTGSNWADLVANTGTTATTYAHTGLAAGTERHYRVSAINTAGTGTASNVVSATTAAAGAPGAPTDLTATADGRTAIDLAWTAPADNGGSAISGYGIEVSSDGGSNWTDLVSDTASTATSYEHTNLDPGTTRHYRVSAVNTAGTGSASNVAHATTEAAPPGAPTGLSATADGKTAIDLAWTVPDDTGGAAVSGYRIEVSSDAGSNWADLVANTGTTATTYAHTGLAAGTERHYRVSAINTAGAGTASNVASATTSAAGAPGAPTDLTATADGRTEIDLAWTAPADNGGSAISGYRIEVSSDGGSNWTDLVSDTASTATSYEHTNLDPGTTRHYRVSAINTAGTGSASNVAHATTDAAPPGAPTGLTVTADGKTEIDLAWTAPDDTGGAGVSGYRIEVSSDAGSNWADLVANTGTTATTYAHTGLAAGTERHYRVSATNSAGTGTASNVVSATTAAAGAPGAPTDLTATADGRTEIDLAWTVPGDNGGSAISGYRIEVSSDGGSNWSDLVSDTASTATSYEHTNLDPGTTRHYRVSATNTAGTGSASNVAHATTEAEPSGAPTGLSATADGQTAIDLAWTAPDDTGGAAVTGYRIEVSSDAGSNWADLVANTGTTATTYAHTGLAAGTERHYRVSAINTAGAGTASNVAGATTSAAGAPGAPTVLTATADGKMAIDLAWTAPADNGGSAISGYRIEVSSDGGSNWTDLVSDTASTATSYEHTNLDPGTTRHYRVSAINTAGTGSASNVAHATTEAEPPGAPTGLSATADGKTAIDLAWTVPDDTGGAAVSGYRIEVSSDAGSNWADLVANTGTTATTYAHTGLAAGTERHYRVSAINTAGAGTASNVASATTSAAGAPGAPTDLTATADGRTEIDLAWTAPADNGGSAISGYRIEVSSDGGSNWSDLVSDTASTATSYEHTNLDPGTTRHYRVSAVNTAGTGSASNVAHATTDAAPPGAPTGLTATADGKTEIDLAWTAPDDTGGAAVSGYRIEVSTDGGSNWADLVASTGTTATTYAHTGLAAGTERHYRVSAINSAGTGSASNVASATTTAAGAPGAPTGLTATADGRTEIDLAWTAPGDNGGSAISGYRIEVSSDGGSNWSDLVSDTASTATSYEHTNLDPGTTRHYRVSATNTAGTGSASNVAHATTDAAPPGAPTGLTATADGKTEIDLAWTAPDDTGGAAVSGYRIEVSSDAGSNWADLVANTGTTATTYAHTGLAAGTERHYRVSATNSAGTGTASNVVSATTAAAGAPGAPTDLTATADGRTAIDLAWTAPADNGGSAISGYRIEVSSDGSSNWSDLVSDTASTATSYEHTNLDPGTTRHYRVSATNTAGTGSASNVAHATTEAAPPGAPTGLSATVDGKTAIDLAWTAPDDTGGAAVSGYRIEVSADAGSSWTNLVSDTGDTATTYTHSGLDPGHGRTRHGTKSRRSTRPGPARPPTWSAPPRPLRALPVPRRT